MLEEHTLNADPPRPEPRPTWQGWLDAVRSRWTLGQLAAGALLAVGVLAAAVAVLRPASAAPPAELSLPMASSSSSAPGPATTAAPVELVVHAAGAVVAPGLYHLAAGTRVADLVAAAGGFGPDADADRVNLAAPLHDGERVAVPRVGEPAMPGGGASSDAPSQEPVDLNAATVVQLDALPGVGPTTAQAIVDDRERNGPYRSVEDLLRVRGIGPAKLDQIRDLVTV